MYKGKYESKEAAPKAVKASAQPRSEEHAAAPRRKPETKRKKKSRVTPGTIVFYSVYLVLIVVFFVGMSFVMKALGNWLVNYEAAQPKVKCQQVFNDLFADPDWEEIYTLAGMGSTTYEGKEAYAAYMRETVGDTELTYIETSAGLSGDKKYIVRCGDEKVATFTLTAENKDAEVPDWQLGTVEVFFSRNLDFTILADPGCTVTVNGIALDESLIVRSVNTTAEKYLPEGVHGYRLAQWNISGLLTAPQVLATDPAGNSTVLSYDAETHTYTQDLAPDAISDSEYETLLTAAQTYCKYMIGAAGKADLKTCFDANAQIYTTITTIDTWMRSYSGYDFSPETITDFYRYSDDLYSAKVSITLNVTRKNGTVKEYELNNNFFLENQEGVWKVIEMTNVDVQEQTTLVRLTYMNGTELVSSEMVDADSSKLILPSVTVPEGKVFSGWFTEAVDAEGNKTMSLAFKPDEHRVVSLPGNTVLEPMTLYALFDAEEG